MALNRIGGGPTGTSRGRTALATAAAFVATIGLGVSGGALAGQLPDPSDGSRATASANTGRQLDRALDRIMAAENGPPGVAVLIRRGDREQFLRRGVADVRTKAKPTRRLHTRIASVAKAFNGGIVLSLADRGKLSLNDRLGKWVPNLLPRARRATIGQVLQHTAGLPEYIHDKRFIDLLNANPTRYMPPRKLVGFVRNKRLDFKPGSRYKYSDTDNVVAGIIAEKASGVGYDRLLRQLGRRSGGLPGTSLPRNVRMPDPFLHGYYVAPGEPPEDGTHVMNPALAWASGGIVSTLPDLGRFFRAYVGGKLFGGRILEAQRQWVRGSSGPPGPGVNWAGMALFRYRTKCGTVFGHTGNYPGYRVFAASSADGRRSIAWVANSQITAETPIPGAKRVSALMRKSQLAAVCHALR